MIEDNLIEAFDQCHINHTLILRERQLISKNIQPIARALFNDQHIMAIDFSNNEISNEGTEYLTKTISTMKRLLKLDLSGNFILSEGIRFLTGVHLSNLVELNLSFNPFGDEGVTHLSKLLHNLINLKKLYLSCCELKNLDTVSMNLKNLQSFDISLNENISGESIRRCLSELSAFKIEDLNLSFTSDYSDFSDDISKFFSVGGQQQINELNLTGCGLNDDNVKELLESLKSYSGIKTLRLSDNNLSWITLKYILNCKINISNVYLLSCPNMLKDLMIDEVLNGTSSNYPNIIHITLTDASLKEEQDVLENLWTKCWSFQARFNNKEGKIKLFKD